ncbi:tryptophan synthase alpha chain TrpA [Gottschalkia purinilytica]|uniref:Tryptophan synthase alpha chain n=1 Tax=Gottschalkia purinilytica TaxID=1503 RepID=A0A0L0W9K8_GOTPU|nr:tryptophan synthase subunit alpha [Gottschalkia purinilytica]KNF08132.1 tryptophan synthase alpha chain TrpA [Gottschalkia purinilytica]
MNRIDTKFQYLKEKNEKALITFITSGDPDLDTTLDLVLEMEKSGADIIELGIPYSDPIADGKTIQESSKRALSKGIKISNIMDTVKKIREKSQIPLVYLAYFNSVFTYGVERFFKVCNEVGIDGVIIPDLPIEEREEILEESEKYNVYLISLVAPTSKERIKEITEKGKGFVYCVSVNGTTGTRSSIDTDLEEYIGLVSEHTDTPKALGFGISSPDMAKKYKDYADGVIVGSAIVKKILAGNSKEEIMRNVGSFVKELKESILS